MTFILKLFVVIVANTGMISIGTGVGMSGFIPAQLKDAGDDLKMTSDEESWFGKYLILVKAGILISLSLIHI